MTLGLNGAIMVMGGELWITVVKLEASGDNFERAKRAKIQHLFILAALCFMFIAYKIDATRNYIMVIPLI